MERDLVFTIPVYDVTGMIINMACAALQSWSEVESIVV